MKDKAFFGYADAREQPELRKQLQPVCSHVCKVSIVKKGEPVSRLEIKHDIAMNKAMLEAYVGPLLSTVASPTDLKPLRKKNAVWYTVTLARRHTPSCFLPTVLLTDTTGGAGGCGSQHNPASRIY